MAQYYNRDAIIADCGGDLTKAAKIIHTIQERYWRITGRLHDPWPEEEPSASERIEAKLDAIQQSLKDRHKIREIIVYRDKPQEEQTESKGLVPYEPTKC